MVYQDMKGDTSREVTHTVEPIQMGQSSAYKEPSSFATNPNASNADFDPIPPSNRTWTWKAYVAYWMADAWAVSNWVRNNMLEMLAI
jgi:NCS1 family nucleobase:cation symporter-1